MNSSDPSSSGFFPGRVSCAIVNHFPEAIMVNSLFSSRCFQRWPLQASRDCFSFYLERHFEAHLYLVFSMYLFFSIDSNFP